MVNRSCAEMYELEIEHLNDLEFGVKNLDDKLFGIKTFGWKLELCFMYFL